ncbi:MAG: hypothetical protein RLY66_693 [Candidatus Parcubacteria bacterium]|jgi:hypothetical protein
MTNKIIRGRKVRIFIGSRGGNFYCCLVVDGVVEYLAPFNWAVSRPSVSLAGIEVAQKLNELNLGANRKISHGFRSDDEFPEGDYQCNPIDANLLIAFNGKLMAGLPCTVVAQV